MRDRITQRLRNVAVSVDPLQRVLANAQGPVSQAFLDSLAEPPRRAAVLIALIERSPGLTVLLTERATHLHFHPGQISLPGGSVAVADSGPEATALREAREEVGLQSADVTVAGTLDVHLTVTGFAVTPVVGFVSGHFHPRPDPAEVARVFEVPLDYLLQPGSVGYTVRERLGTRFRTPEFHYQGHRIWGATAVMLRAFLELISIDKP